MASTHPSQAERCISRVLDDPMVRAAMAADGISDAAMIAVLRRLIRDLARRQRANDASNRVGTFPAAAILLQPCAVGTLDRGGLA